ncbi:MAG: 50S ribosomal protein L6, partial [Candidatus Omnitrophica bacterium]|nr:50S ribosomal protein L6 [Candidatus Omnitrophota bacterium]
AEQIIVTRATESKRHRSLHGLARSLINNMVIGVSQGFSKQLEIIGVGFKAQIQGKNISMQVGYSHPAVFPIPEGITVELPNPTLIIVKGIDKFKVGQAAADIRILCPPEPYKGKGIRYVGEYVRRKAGKTVA